MNFARPIACWPNLGQARPLAVRPGTPPPARSSALARNGPGALRDAGTTPANELDTAALGTVRRPRGSAGRPAPRLATTTPGRSFLTAAIWWASGWETPDGRASRRLVGARAALPLAARVFRRLGAEGMADWPNPGGELQEIEVCAVSGLPRSGWCPHTRPARLPRRQYLNRLCGRPLARGRGPGECPPAHRGALARFGQGLGSGPHHRAGHILARPNEPKEPVEVGPVHALQILSPPNAAKFIMNPRGSGRLHPPALVH